MSEQPSRPSDSTRVVPLARGELIAGRYELDRPIASGGMATVWQATDTVLTRPVAVKILHAHLAEDPEFVARFRREAIAAARLSHPNIVATYDTSDDPECIVMELVEGRTLREELDRRGFLPSAEVVAIGAAVAKALEAAHRAGIVHRDIKPANVLLAPDGRPKVADFGIAKAARDADPNNTPGLDDLTTVGRMVGTAKYLAPEQVRGGEVDARTDVYALGAVLYETLCGRPPFDGDNDLAVATARLDGPPERPRSVLRTIPDRLDEIVMRCLETEPGDRYPSAGALWAELDSCSADEIVPPSATPGPVDATRIDQPTFATSERSWLVPAGLLTVVGGALILVWLLIGGTEVRRDFFDLVDRVTPAIGSDPAPRTLEATPAAFDPLGDGTEHDQDVLFAVDGDEATGWQTERYASRDFGGLKAGVGLVLDLGETAELRDVQVRSPQGAWRIEIHVADRPAPTVAGWGDPVATVTDQDRVAFPDGTTGSYVLVWITDLGDSPAVILELTEVVVRAG